MEQAPGLTMNPPSVPPSPGPPSAPNPASHIKSSTPNPSDTIPSGSGTSSSSEIVTPTPKTAAERGFGHGLDRGNLEAEVTQVMGTLNNWWGGVKKQVSKAVRLCIAPLCVRNSHFSRSAPRSNLRPIISFAPAFDAISWSPSAYCHSK
jgi:hypothetical protein